VDLRSEVRKMKLLYSVALPDAILRNPHASMFVFFISAFTLFALAGEDNDLVRAKKKKRSFFSRVFHFMEDEEPTEEVSLSPHPVPKWGIASDVISRSTAKRAHWVYQ